MRYYLDTNTLIFYLKEDLDYDSTAIINDYSNRIYISTIAIKEFIHWLQTKKFQLKNNIKPKDAIAFIQDTLGFKIIDTNTIHLNQFANLPLFADHTDPNDRLIIAQAISDKINIISCDSKFHYYEKYGLKLIKATH